MSRARQKNQEKDNVKHSEVFACVLLFSSELASIDTKATAIRNKTKAKETKVCMMACEDTATSLVSSSEKE